MNYFSGDLASIDWLGSKLISRNYYRTHACTGTVAVFLDLLVDLQVLSAVLSGCVCV